MSLSDKRLLRLFRYYNRKYFDGRLADTDVLYAPIEGCCGWACRENGEDIIVISPKHALDFNAVKIALLHECAHVSLFPYAKHGKPFQREIARLFVMGAYKGLL